MDKYLNKQVEIREKNFASISSANIPFANSINVTTGTMTGIVNDRFVEIDNHILISMDYIYQIEILD